MANYNTQAGVTITINGRQAQQMLDQLRKQAEQAEQNLQKAAAAGDRISMQRYRKELEQTRRAMNQLQGQAATAHQVLSRLDTATPRELRKALTQLNRELNNMERGSAAWNAHVEKIRRVRAELDSVNRQLRAQGEETTTLFGKIGNLASRHLGGIVGGIATLSGAMAMARRSIDAYADVQEEMAGVSKYSGMATADVEKLNEEFKKMDTRTSRVDLNKAAQDAGRLGKTTIDEILGYVRAADQINIALDDLGEGATLTLSKLTDIFGLEAQMGTEESLIRVGSVINDLSQSCSASAPYIAEFTSRMGGVGRQAGLTVQQIMAFGALLDSQGMNVEAASTALQQLTVRLMTEPAKYAKAAGIEVEKFSRLVKEDMNGAMMLFFETLHNTGDMNVLAPMFADMGEKGSNSVKVLSTMANQIETLKIRQQEANEAFEAGTSISNEAAVANSTVRAELDKANNKFLELSSTLGQSLWPVATLVLKTAGGGVTVLATLIDLVTKQWRLIVSAGIAVAGYTIAVKAQVIAETAHAGAIALKNGLMKTGQVLMAAVTAGYHLASAGLMTLVGNTTGAAAAMASFNAICAANPIGAVVTALSAAAVAMSLFSNEGESAVDVQEKMASVTEKSTLMREEETQALKDNITRIEEFNGTKEEESKLVSELNNRYGKFFGQYSTLASWLQVLKNRGEDYIDVVYQEIAAEAKLEAARQLIADAAKKRQEGADYDPGWWQTFNATITTDGNYNISFNSWKTARRKVKDQEKAAADAQADMMEATAQRLIEEAEKDKKNAREKRRNQGVTPFRSADDRDAWIREQDKRSSSSSSEHTSEKETKNQGREEKKRKRKEREHRRETAEEAGDRQKADAMRLKEDLKALQMQQKAEEQQMELDFYSPSSEVYNSEEKKQAALHQIRLRYLKKQRDFYDEESAEYLQFSGSIAEEEGKEKLRILKIWESALDEWSEDYQHRNARQKFDDEMAILRVLYDNKKISEEDFQKAIKEIEKKYADDTIDGYSGNFSNPAAGQSARQNFEAAKADLEAWYADNEDQTEEYQRRLRELEKEYYRAGAEAAKSSGGEWGAMVVNLYDAFHAFFENSEEDGRNWAEKMGALAQAATSMMCAGLQAYQEYSNACNDLEIARIERRYNHEIELAEGNSYRERKTEEAKENAIAKIKAEAARKDFAIKVATAIGQTATNALTAYGSALHFPYPLSIILGAVAAGLATAQGIAQIAILKKQQQAAEAQGYAEGGFTKPGGKNEPAGVVHAGEWVASQKLVNNPVARPIIDMLEYAQRTNTMAIINREDVSRSINATAMAAARTPAPRKTTDRNIPAPATDTRLNDTVDRLTRRLDQPFVTVATVSGDKGINKAQDEYKKLLQNKRPKTHR